MDKQGLPPVAYTALQTSAEDLSDLVTFTKQLNQNSNVANKDVKFAVKAREIKTIPTPIKDLA